MCRIRSGSRVPGTIRLTMGEESRVIARTLYRHGRGLGAGAAGGERGLWSGRAPAPMSVRAPSSPAPGAEWRYTVTKTGRPHVVPLARQAVAILREVHPLTGHHRYVFPNARHPHRILPMGRGTLWSAFRALDIPKDRMTMHGFRAMARTILDEVLGLRPDFIEHQLAHAVRDPNGRAYNRTAFLSERRVMMQAWADYLDRLRAGEEIESGAHGPKLVRIPVSRRSNPPDSKIRQGAGDLRRDGPGACRVGPTITRIASSKCCTKSTRFANVCKLGDWRYRNRVLLSVPETSQREKPE